MTIELENLGNELKEKWVFKNGDSGGPQDPFDYWHDNDKKSGDRVCGWTRNFEPDLKTFDTARKASQYLEENRELMESSPPSPVNH